MIKQNKKQYKALMLDVDGTLMQNQKDGLPSARVREAIQKAKNSIHVGVATGRPLHQVRYLLDYLSLTGPCIINGGIQVYDATSKKIVRQQVIDPLDIPSVVSIAQEMSVPLLLAKEEQDEAYYVGHPLTDVFGLFSNAIDEALADRFIDRLKDIPTITAHKTSSWEPNSVHVGINHPLATKQHGILETAQILGIETEDIIGVGDHYNDFPLLMACGLKIAMGNAVEDLKAIADYVAPTVDDDGVAHVIEKFIL